MEIETRETKIVPIADSDYAASMDTLENVRVVLVEPEHPGNIGAAARAMANMGLRHLVLVAPHDFPSPVASARASGCEVLRDVRVVDSLDEAITDCTLVVAASARARAVPWPHRTPEAAMRSLLEPKAQRAALLFGRESTGLTNAELDRCHFQTRIPVADSFSSMNLGSAVSVLLYELRRQALALGGGEDLLVDELAGEALVGESDKGVHCTAADMRRFYEHLELVLDKSDPSRDSFSRMRLLTRVFNRAPMLAPELRLLRGILSSVEAKLDSEADESAG